MVAYKCDRCGGFYERDAEVCIKRTHYKIECYDTAKGRRSVNLCDGCRQLFVNWFTEYKEDTDHES